MKKAYGMLIISAVLCLMSAFVVQPVNAAKKNKSLVVLEEPHITQVSDAEFKKFKKGAVATSNKSFAKEIQKNALKRKKTFTVTYSGSETLNIDKVFNAIGEIDDKKTSDDSDFLKGGILSLGWSGYSNSKGEVVAKCKLVYTENADQVKSVNKTAKSVLKKLKVKNMSDVAKVKTIHDYVVKLVTYDNSLKDHSAYGGLSASKHSTVCQGYALIMYKLLTDAGVPCHYVTGDAGGPHAWNIVKIKGKWYYLDATWDDPSDTTVYDYFLVGSKTLKKDHKTDSYYTKKYKIASGNLNWKSLIKKSAKKGDKKVKTTQTAKEIQEGKDALAREEVILELNNSFDEMLKESPDASEYEVQLYDLCKKTYGCIIKDMSDDAFNALLEDENMMNTYIDSTMQMLSEYIIDPMTEYMSGDEFMNEIISQMYADFGEEEFADMSDDDLDYLIDAYAYELYTQVLYELSDEYTDAIVAAMVETLNGMV